MVLDLGLTLHHEQDRRAYTNQRIVAQRAAEVETVAVGELGVKHDHVRVQRLGPLEHRGARVYPEDEIAPTAEETLEVLNASILIAGDEDARRTGNVLTIWHPPP